MKSDALRQLTKWSRGEVFLCLLALGVGTVTALLAGHPMTLLVLAAAVAVIVFALTSLREPLAFVTAFLVTLIVLPPFFWGPLGEMPIYVCSFLVPLGLAIALVRLPDFRFRFDPVARGLVVFLLGTGLSLPFGWYLSGAQVAGQSLFRWLMPAQTALVYFFIRGGARQCETRMERLVIPVLVIAAVLSAAYGIVDFIWPIPVPHPAADQLIWLRTAIVRRAQGVFYEAGNFGNMCAFFLVVVAAALLSKQERTVRISRPLLALFVGILSLATFVSFTRSTWASLVVALLVFVGVSNGVRLKRGILFLAILAAPLVFLWFYSPGLWDYLLISRLGDLAQIFEDPNLASSGRFDTWLTLVSIVQTHPQYLPFGIGYKTLPFTRLFHQEIITDNGFLNLLLETGVIGLGGFLFFSVAIFKTFLQTARLREGELAFWGSLLFSFRCGEWVQMMAVDAHTYWRNMVVFLAVMGLVMNRIERAERCLVLGQSPATG